ATPTTPGGAAGGVRPRVDGGPQLVSVPFRPGRPVVVRLVPVPPLATGTSPETVVALAAVRLHSALGVAVSACRGASDVKAPPEPGRTAISSHRALPANAEEPKSSGTVKSPSVTTTPAAVRMGPTRRPSVSAGKTGDCRPWT